jgi:integrase
MSYGFGTLFFSTASDIRKKWGRQKSELSYLEEARLILNQWPGTVRIMTTLLYGSGLRLLECCRLRIKNVDFRTNRITVRAGKGDKDRVTLFPALIKDELAAHIECVRTLHQKDVALGAGWVELPAALARKYPNAGREWAWQWIFPATRIYVDRRTAERRSHHLHESVLQRLHYYGSSLECGDYKLKRVTAKDGTYMQPIKSQHFQFSVHRNRDTRFDVIVLRDTTR